MIDLSQAVPGYAAHPLLFDALSTASQRTDLLGYGSIAGEAPLREAYAKNMSGIFGAPVTANEVHI